MKISKEQAFELFQQALANEVAAERYTRWRMGDLIRLAIATGGEKMVVYRAAAEIMGKSIRWVAELAKVAETFSEEKRLPDIDWYMYRLATNTEDPQATLKEALDEEWSPKELKASLDQSDPAPSTEIKGEFVLDYSTTSLRLTPVGALDVIELGEGLEDIPVKATIKSNRRKS
jgi:hypothetical protein